MIRSAIAIWKGSPLTGEGLVTTTSGVMNKALYSFGSSTGNEPCTSPSEMLASAVASCMSLMMVQELSKLGMRHGDVKTEAVLRVEETRGRWNIAGIQLNITAALPKMDEETFHRVGRSAKSKCPISRALHVPITITTKLQVLEEATVAS